MAFASRWTARAAGWTTSSSKGCGGRSNTNVSISILSRPEAKPRPASALGSATTTGHGLIRLWMARHRAKPMLCKSRRRDRCSPSGSPRPRRGLHSISFARRPAIQGRMRPCSIVIADPGADAGPGLASRLESMEIDAFVFERSPQPFDEHIVHPAAFAAHRDADTVALQHLGEGEARELRALVGVEDLRPAIAGDRFFQRRDAEVGVHGVR